MAQLGMLRQEAGFNVSRGPFLGASEQKEATTRVPASVMLLLAPQRPPQELHQTHHTPQASTLPLSSLGFPCLQLHGEHAG